MLEINVWTHDSDILRETPIHFEIRVLNVVDVEEADAAWLSSSGNLTIAQAETLRRALDVAIHKAKRLVPS